MKKEIDMLHGSLVDKIFRFALPLAFTGILQQLFNAADVAVVGRLVGGNAMAAVGSNTPIVGLIVNLFVGISLGANVVIATLTGKGDKEGVHRAVHTAVLVALLVGVLAAVVGELGAAPLLRAMSVPDEVYPMALLYLRIYLAGMPVVSLYNFESAVFRSQGDTRTPLVCLVISGIVNVILNVTFVAVFHMAADGVALATVISVLISSVLLFLFLRRGTGAVRLVPGDIGVDRALLGRILRIGVPAGVQGMVFSFSNIILQSAINSLGAKVMAASSAAFNVEIFSYFFISAFAQACTTFVGQNYGARQLERCRRVTRCCFLIDVCVCVALSAGIILACRPLLGVFSPDPEIIRLGTVRVYYLMFPQLLSVAIDILSGAMRGYGHSAVPAVITLIGVCGVRILWVYTVFRARPAFDVLMMSYPISWAVTSALLLAVSFRVRRQAAAELSAAD